ncbi:MAG: transglycosylase SLT domain-containing protein [Saprospiraceae bacterium]|jgi:membrane-bound lytic murein transglycosylase D
MQFPWTWISATAAATVAVAGVPNTNLYSKVADNSVVTNEWNADVVSERLAKLQLPVPVQSNEQVLSRIRQYLITGRAETQLALGRSNVYFPIFEHQLRANGLPEELKYLPLIESGLSTTIESPAGATGMWQLMSITARHFGLQVNSGVDERLDIYRSTDAAVKMLVFLHKKFGDWALVLAAYNSGVGKVEAAIRMAGTKDYWVVKDYLPKETQRYVPCFIAAAYVGKYFRQHGLKPANFQTHEMPDLRVMLVFRRISFGEISRVTGVGLSALAKLNPAFTQGIVPASDKGYFVMLPDEKATLSLRNFLASPEERAAEKAVFRTTYVVSKGDSMEEIARLFQTSVEDLLKWNKLTDTTLVVRQELVLQLPKTFLLNRA